jgi:hypothetical protein
VRLCLAVVLSACLLATPHAQDAPPLPAALTSARTVYVVNGGVPEKVFTRCVADLQKWGRYTLTGEPSEADLRRPATPRRCWSTRTGPGLTIRRRPTPRAVPDGPRPI